MRLAGKIALVTGAGSGIGRATAQRLAHDGAHVFCVDVAKADVVAAEIATAGGSATPAVLDVVDAAGWAALIATVRDQAGGVDFLANVAGVVSRGPDTVLEQTEEEWDRVVNIDLKGTWLGMRAVLPSMIERGGGRIVNIASMAAVLGIRNLAAYTSAKGGVAALTRQVAIEHVEQNITVNAIAPGFIRTPIVDGLPEEMLKEMAGGIPMKRLGAPSDIAAMIAHLCSDDGSYITGQLIAIDGGWSIY
jgi:NAD(P)-dependent dehydrogenase (short-subunit alcohol dehydrogenase family)